MLFQHLFCTNTSSTLVTDWLVVTGEMMSALHTCHGSIHYLIILSYQCFSHYHPILYRKHFPPCVVFTLNSVTLLQKVMLRVQSSVCWLSQVWSTCSALCHVLCCIVSLSILKVVKNNLYAILNIAVTVSLTMYPMFQE